MPIVVVAGTQPDWGLGHARQPVSGVCLQDTRCMRKLRLHLVAVVSSSCAIASSFWVCSGALFVVGCSLHLEYLHCSRCWFGSDGKHSAAVGGLHTRLVPVPVSRMHILAAVSSNPSEKHNAWLSYEIFGALLAQLLLVVRTR